jgi:predicted esterase
MPIHIVHSRVDDVVPFEPAAKAAEDLSRTGHLVNFIALENVGHYEMVGYLKALREAGDWVREQWNSLE